MDFSVCFLILSRTTWPGMALPTETWVLLCQSLIKKTPCRLVHRTSLWRGDIFSISISYSQMSRLVSSGYKTNRYISSLLYNAKSSCSYIEFTLYERATAISFHSVLDTLLVTARVYQQRYSQNTNQHWGISALDNCF